MDRLTKRSDYNCACWNGNQDYIIRKRYLVMLDALAAYEDTGLTPDEIAALRAELDAFKARWTETASDNTDYTLSHLDGIYTVSDLNGCVVCEFIRDAALEKEVPHDRP